MCLTKAHWGDVLTGLSEVRYFGAFSPRSFRAYSGHCQGFLSEDCQEIFRIYISWRIGILSVEYHYKLVLQYLVCKANLYPML